MKFALSILALLLAFLVLPRPAAGRDLLPKHWFEDIQAVDGSVQRCLVFHTVAGVAYRVESSGDLAAWQPDQELYGMGHEFVVPLYEFTPSPAGPGTGSGTPPATFISLQLRPSSGVAGGTVVSWKSLDHGGPVVIRIAAEMDAAWQTVPLFAERHDDFYFLVQHPTGSVSPPASNPLLGSSDAAMLAVLEAHIGG